MVPEPLKGTVLSKLVSWCPKNDLNYRIHRQFWGRNWKDKLYQHRPQIAKTNFCVINVKKKCPPPNHSTLQWHPQWHPATSTVHSPQKLVVTLPANHRQTTMAPCNGTASTPPKLAVTLPYPHHGTLQWHPAMAPSNVHRPLPQSWVTVTLPANHSNTTMAPCNGTTSTHPKLAVTLPYPHHGTLQWHHVHSPKVGRHPSPKP